ncbi:hypothetical protein [Litorilituus sediminis]|uniref:Uncharacterized protein n=1 Tax=Litorilituus sediminis TaxID=718192 RepID=A0A4P6P1I5_9GAMM|nr:hypothetical protein [Litorilituus sediminis]QBG34903.1 hypothetical protein EMK97_03710 [Litorilituus sediminis]
MKFINLATINAAGTSEKSLYGAISTDMFFGQLSNLEIRIDKNSVAQYFTVSIPVIESLNFDTKKAILVEECLKNALGNMAKIAETMPINAIEDLLVVTSAFEEQVLAKEQWQSMVKASVSSLMPNFSEKISFQYSKPDNDNQEYTLSPYFNEQALIRPTLMLCVDVLTSYNHIKQLNQLVKIQHLDGPQGIMPAEGASCSLLLPEAFPLTKLEAAMNISTVKSDDGATRLSLSAQLSSLGFTYNSTIIHVGTLSQSWTKYWYAQTNDFYQQAVKGNQGQMLLDQTRTLGYLGVANLPTAFACAKAYLTSPMKENECVWVVEHSNSLAENAKPLSKVYKVKAMV